MVRGQGATALGDQVRLRHALVGADLLHGIDDVRGVLLHRVVERGDESGAARADVIDAEAAADVEVLQPEPHLPQLGVEPRALVHHVLDGADVRELRADVEVEELDEVELAGGFQHLDGADELRRGEPELGKVSGRRLPLARPFGGQLAAQPDQRLHVHLVGELQEMRQLGQLLDDDDDLPSQLASDEGEAEVLLVLVAVADGEGLGVGVEREDDQQLALAARFQAEVIRRAGVEDLLDHLPHLVHLRRVDAEVLPFVAVLVDRAAEDVVELLDAAAEHVLEADHAGEAELALADVVHHVHQIDHRARLPEGVDHHVALGVDAEVPGAPSGNVVELQRSFDGPVIRHR